MSMKIELHFLVEAETCEVDANDIPSFALSLDDDALIISIGLSMLKAVEVITTLGEIGGGILGGALKEADVLNALSLNMIAIVDPFGLYFHRRCIW